MRQAEPMPLGGVAPRAAVPDRLPRTAAELALRWEILLLVFLALVFLVNMQLSPYFLDPYNLSDGPSASPRRRSSPCRWPC